jgi:hypothetical protein
VQSSHQPHSSNQSGAAQRGLYYDLGHVTSLATSLPLITPFTEGARYDIAG